MQQLQITGIKEIERIAQQTADCISLSQGVLKVGGIPSPIKTYLQSILATNKADYYEGEELTNLLKDKLATHLKTRYNTDIPKDQLLVSHGCIGALSVLFLTILDPGDEVLLPEPTYPVYFNVIKLAKGTPVYASVKQTDEGNRQSWRLDIDTLNAQVTSRTKAILFSNPCNPIGSIASQETLKELIAWAEEKKIYVIVDEVYEDYIFEGTFHSVVPLIPSSPWIIRASSFSKNFAMSGWRIGYIILPKHLVNPWELMQHSLLICPSVLGQWAAAYALDHPELSIPFYAKLSNNLKTAVHMLEPLISQGIISYIKPKAGFFLFLKTEEENATGRCLDIIKHAKVTLVPGEKFGPSGNSYLRLCYAREEGVLQEGLSRLVNYFQNHSLR